ncbi:DUF3037 domain-containing protein [Leucobacter coleopterorum]|uniref:DUF3037 domain-containing protein n=1 Tax=Leucobacter coleopterorum TaxID=2714933 RepID=A0ABX6K127_9MICO|nr:DUF3037 domain-containing protein [Leucobacter coleopterorum]QIM19568.1 DUF3037 domain-containing protein [Leucobacter coleopterorum]
MLSYQYWIIRYVPDIARGEFTNIGLLCGRDGGDWAVQFDTEAVRSRGELGPNLRELAPWMVWFERRITRQSQPQLQLELNEQTVSSGWISHLHTRQANSVQFSEARPVDVPSAAEGVKLLFPHLVARETVTRSHTLTRASMRAKVRHALELTFNLTLNRDLFIQPRVVIGKQRSTVDFLRRDNNEDTITNVWAFNSAKVELLEQQVQATNYSLTRLRDTGAEIRFSDGKSVAIQADIPVSVIYDPPTSQRELQWRTDVFDAALEAWHLNGISVQSLEEFRSASANVRRVAAGTR